MKRHAIHWAAALAALGVSACIIGPKQDDPASVEVDTDAGATPDTTTGVDTDNGAADTGTASTTNPDAGGFSDAPTPGTTDADARADGDAGCGDGSVAITASRFNDVKKCWGETVFFECQAGPDGGAAETCFVQISTGALYKASSTQIPSGGDFRLCNDAERTRTAGATSCK